MTARRRCTLGDGVGELDCGVDSGEGWRGHPFPDRHHFRVGGSGGFGSPLEPKNRRSSSDDVGLLRPCYEHPEHRRSGDRSAACSGNGGSDQTVVVGASRPYPDRDARNEREQGHRQQPGVAPSYGEYSTHSARWCGSDGADECPRYRRRSTQGHAGHPRGVAICSRTGHRSASR